MRTRSIRIGTRDSELALWQAYRVKELLEQQHCQTELVPIKSEGDLDLVTPLYAMGVQGVFTRALDAALLSGRIDVAVHSMKDVPVQLAQGLAQAAVLKRGSHRDLLVPAAGFSLTDDPGSQAVIATSSIRRRAQWRNRYPLHQMENLRGNINTRLRKLGESSWQGAIFAAAGLERIGLRPPTAVDIDWMLPAPAQGAIMVVGRANDDYSLQVCSALNHEPTALCVRLEREFLSALQGGCSTPISALAEFQDGWVRFQGNIVAPDGSLKAEVSRTAALTDASHLGKEMALELLDNGGAEIVQRMARHGG